MYQNALIAMTKMTVILLFGYREDSAMDTSDIETAVQVKDEKSEAVASSKAEVEESDQETPTADRPAEKVSPDVKTEDEDEEEK